MKKSRFLVMGVLMVAVSGLVAARGSLIQSDSVLVVDLGGEIPEAVAWSPFMSLFGEEPLVVLDKLICLEKAARDKRIKAVVARITRADYGFAKAQEFRDAIERFKKDSGKPIFAYLELEGGGNIEYYLATTCTRVYISPASSLGLTGLSTFRFYLGGLWEKIYVDMQVDQIKEYKSMADMLARRDMSEHEREMNNAILDSLYGQFVDGIAQGRGVTDREVRAWIDAAWFLPEKYVEADALDGIKYLNEVIEEAAGAEKAKVAKEKDYLDSVSGKKPSMGAEKVAVVYAVGNIVAGDPGRSLGRGNIIASDPMTKSLIKVMEDDSIKAVIYRVDSGGGSALASDLIWQATQRVKTKKPIIVSMSDVAASGGYYISCGATAVLAQPGTITGSIGILTARPSIGKLLKKIGVGTETMGRGEYSGMKSIDRRLTDRELSRVHDNIASLYDLFISRVSLGREISKDQVNQVGRGRVWTGEQAKDRNLVDGLGGFNQAISEVKKALGIPEDKEVQLVYKREPITLWKLLTGRIEEEAMKTLLSPEEREIIAAIRVHGLFRPYQPLALMPGPIKVQ